MTALSADDVAWCDYIARMTVAWAQRSSDLG
jgi:hypothetical protein